MGSGPSDDGATPEQTVALPPYQPLPADTVLGETTVAEIEQMLARETTGDQSQKWQRNRAKKARSVTRAHIDQFIAQANGTQANPLPDQDASRIEAARNGLRCGLPVERVAQITGLPPGDVRRLEDQRSSPLVKWYTLHQLAEQIPSLGLRHLLRLGHNPAWVCRWYVDPETDLRAVADALTDVLATRSPGQRAVRPDGCGCSSIPEHLVRGLARGIAEPEAAWPWLHQHPEVAREWLTGSPVCPPALPGYSPGSAVLENQAAALRVLACYPRVPSSLAPLVAALALGSSKTLRPLAQQALAAHPTARTLAEQGLTDGKAETRTAAARWLATIGDAAAVPALRTALGKEKREVVRAGLLGALEALGADLTAELSPQALAAEATKGLKSRPPASMAWFGLDHLPGLRWADGSTVEPDVIRWWVVLAVKMKNPDGSGLLDRYLSLLHPDDADRLGRITLHAWIDQDTRRPDPDESQAYAQTEGAQRYATAQRNLAAWIKQHHCVIPGCCQSGSMLGYDQWLANAQRAAAVPLEQHVAAAYAEHQAVYLGSASADKGMLALTTRMSGVDLAAAVQGYIRHHGARRAQVEMLVHTLYGNGQSAAIQLLLSVARRHRQATVQAKAMGLVERLAEARGWTADELADRTIPTAGFDPDRRLHLNLGSREVLGHLTPAGTIALSVAGKAVKSLPTQRADDDPELYAAAKKQLSAARKEAKAVLALQTSRLYEAMCTGRTWTVADWQQHLADHPLVRDLAARLIWTRRPDDDPAGGAFRLTDDGTCINTDDEQITLAGPPGASTRISLAHATTLGPQATVAWRQHLADYEITPPFSQLDADLPDLPATTTVIDDLKGHLTDSFAIRSVATRRGYTRGLVEDAGWFCEYTKAFTSQNVVAVLEFTGAFVPEENITVATRSLSFRRGRRQLPLGDVPGVLAAECYADYAALAALGPYDPDWETKTP